jgi:predicted AlkP superfamily pyrophosphatase or phosphodiesterase
MLYKGFTIAFLLVAFQLCAQKKNIPYVILISFDGFKSDYINVANLPNFKEFIKKGASAEGLIPSFPSKTFPNHYTLVTGLYPGNHGLVDNQFYDPARGTHYGMRIKEAVTDSYYYGGIPLWQLCKQNNIRSASYFWVGSELKDEKLHPDFYQTYDQSVPFGNRIDQVISWLKLPEEERPHFISLYFSSPDNESHLFGPNSPETLKSVVTVDSLLGSFMKQVKETKLPVNVFLVSDHGMSELRHQRETYIFLDDIIKPGSKGITVANGGTQTHIYSEDQHIHDSLRQALDGLSKQFTVVSKEDFPERWHYDNARSGDLLILARPGYYIVTGNKDKTLNSRKENALFGVHGYDAFQVHEMFGIFYAQGPAIKAGSKIPAFENIHVYPLIAKILGVKNPDMDGKIEVLESILKK